MKKIAAHRMMLFLAVCSLLFSSLCTAASAEPTVTSDYTPLITEQDRLWYTNPEQAGVYVISNAAELAYFNWILRGENGVKQDSFNGKTVRLDADIVWNAGTAGESGFAPAGDVIYRWTPAGVASDPAWKGFRGTLDGQGHCISGLYMEQSDNCLGFFVSLRDAVVKNIALVNTYFSMNSTDALQWYGGTVAAQAYGKSCTFENIHVEVYQSNNTANYVQYVGGILGSNGTASSNTPVSFSDCTVEGVVSGYAAVGGILGTNTASRALLTDCVCYAELNSNKESGGMIGRCSADAQLTRCHYFGDIGTVNLAYKGALVYLDRKNLGAELTAADGTAKVSFTDCYYRAKTANDSYYRAVSVMNTRYWFHLTVSYTGEETVDYTCAGGTAISTENAVLRGYFKSLRLSAGNGAALAGIVGVQEGANTAGQARFDVRFVSTLQTAEQIDNIGFEYALLCESGYVTYEPKNCASVYTSILANYGAETVTASDYENASYLFALTLRGAPAAGMVTFLVRPYTETDGTACYGSYLLITYVDGRLTAAATA